MKLKKDLTYNVKPSKDVVKKWYIIDAAGKSLGKVAVKAAYILRGKHKSIYTPYLDCGDNVIIINAAKAVLTGNKFTDKIYYSHSQYPGGLKSINYAKLIEKKPNEPLEKAIKGMLPKGPLGRELFRNLRVYKDEKHMHASQNPIPVEIK
jgi:large subunit ribosomal protein L13